MLHISHYRERWLYHFNSRIKVWSLLSDKECRKTYMILLNMSRVRRTVVLDRRNALFTVFWSGKIMSQIYWFQYTTYLSAQLPRKTYHFKGNTLHRRKIEMVNARLLVQQFMHPVHPNSSYRLSYLLRQFVDNTGKICNRQQTKYKRKTTSKTVHRKTFLVPEK